MSNARFMNVVLVEDTPVMQRMLTKLLSTVTGLNLVGMAAGEAEAIELIARLQPDLVLLDLFLTPGHGLNVLKALRDAGNQCHVIIVSNETHDEYRVRSRALGALSFHHKGDGLPALLHDLQRLALAA